MMKTQTDIRLAHIQTQEQADTAKERNDEKPKGGIINYKYSLNKIHKYLISVSQWASFGAVYLGTGGPHIRNQARRNESTETVDLTRSGAVRLHCIKIIIVVVVDVLTKIHGGVGGMRGNWR